MLSLFSLKETRRKLLDGEWSPKNDLHCLVFFLLVQWFWGSGVWSALFLTYRALEIYAIYMCWRANGAGRRIDFLRRFLALYRCCTLRLWALCVPSIVLIVLAGFIGCIVSGRLYDALNGECAPLLVDKTIGILNVHLSSSSPVSELLSVGNFVYLSVYAFFWQTIDSALVKLSVRKPYPALPAGSEPLSDLSD